LPPPTEPTIAPDPPLADAGGMTRNPYDKRTATAFKAVREVPRDGLAEWREAVGRYLTPGMTVVDIGAGTGAYATAFAEWFDVDVVAVEPSDAMRSHIPGTIQALAGNANALPLPDASADAAWLSLVIHHVTDLEGAAHEIRRVLRSGAPVLLRQGFPDRYEPAAIELSRWFPETARAVETFPTFEEACAAFAAAGFRLEAAERVREVQTGSLADFLGEADTFRDADTTMRQLTDDEFQRGKERLRRAVEAGNQEPRANWLDLVVLR
jgi:ubiquinone/menaquinone biosynthesis C-methylase UbiE